MSDDSDSLKNEASPRPIRHREILIGMAAITAVMAVAGFAFFGRMFGLGVMFGGILSFANYLWLDRSTQAIFSQTASASTVVLAAKYVARYLALGGVLLLVYLTGAFPMPAVIAGLSVFALAVVLQGLKNIFTNS